MGDGRQELVERDRVHLTERKRDEVHQIATVGENPCEPRPRSRGGVDQAQREPERHRDEPRQAADERQRQAAREASRRVHQHQHPAIPLAGVEPRDEAAARAKERREGPEACLGLRQVVEHSDRVDQLHALRTQGRAREVSLDHVDVVEIGGVVRRGVHGRTEVHADDFPGAERRGEPEMAALAAAGIEHTAPDEGVGPDRSRPPQHLGFVLRADLGEARPFVAEALGGAELLDGERRWKQARDAARDGIARAAGAALELALTDIAGDRHCPGQRERATACRTREPVEQAPLHAGWYREAQSWKARSV